MPLQLLLRCGALAALFVALPHFLHAQLSGRITDSATGEELPFVSVFVQGGKIGTSANGEGYYRLPLSPGTYKVVFQYVGYEQKVETVEIGTQAKRLNVQLTASANELGEVTITGADPADRIMREVIAKRRYFRDKIGDHSCDVYIKGFYKIGDAPRKIMGQDVGTMGGVLDTAGGSGVLYLSESVSKLQVQRDPARQREVMISSKVSGSENGFSLNRATLTDFNLYEEHINVERDLLSPLADNAFAYYRFKLLGKYRDVFGFDIYKIAVQPRRPADPTFFGTLYVVDEQWNLARADLGVTGAAIKQPVLDTLRIRQEFVPVELPDTWALLSQVTAFQFGILGFKINGFYNGVFSNYDLAPNFTEGTFTREAFKVEDRANERDSAYWAEVRPVPLTEEEHRDYVKKDSLSDIWESKPFRDSMDRRANKFHLMDLLSGYSWRNSSKHVELDFPGAFKWVQFNTVQGWLVDIHPEFTKYNHRRRRTKFTTVTGTLNYGFSEQKLRYGLGVKRRFESIHYTEAALDGGLLTEQFDGNPPIGPLVNGLYSLLLERNYLKLYEKTFVKGRFSRDLAPALHLNVQAEYARRRPLANSTAYTWRDLDERTYSVNDPIFRNSLPVPSLTEHQVLLLDVRAYLRFRARYSSYPGYREMELSDLPEIALRYRMARPIGGAVGSSNFDYFSATVYQNQWSWGLWGYSEWSVAGGWFWRKKSVAFPDRYHPLANETVIVNPDRRNRSFLLLPYYERSTDDAFVEAHWQHHFEGFFLDKIPGIRRLNWKEVLTVNAFSARGNALEAVQTKVPSPYWEVALGFENMGVKAFRGVRVDAVVAFEREQFSRFGVVFGLGF